jgi:uncharacterized protein (TIGR00369 family)
LAVADMTVEPPLNGMSFDVDALCAYLAEAWPERSDMFDRSLVEELTPSRIRLRRPAALLDIRPGGTIGGPSIMGLADGAAYLVVLAHLGRAALAVTSHLSINFLRRAQPGDLIADASLLKLGRSLAIVDVKINSVTNRDGTTAEAPIAAALVTYSLSLLSLGDRAHS